jgi:hypothetical protein
MKRLKSHIRWAKIVLAGGFLVQATGCAAGLAPVLTSYVESYLLQFILTALFI